MDNAILYAGIEELNTIKEYVLELKSYEEKNSELEQEEARLEKVISEKKKEMADEIEVVRKKRKKELTSSYEGQIAKLNSKAKKIKSQKGKEKGQKVAKRVTTETAELRDANNAIMIDIKALMKKNKTPRICNTTLFYSFFMPKAPVEFLILFLGILITFLMLPLSVYWLFFTDVGALSLALIYIIITILFGGAYVVLNNILKIKHLATLKEIKSFRHQYRLNRKKMKSIKKGIRKDTDESSYGLEQYDAELGKIEKEIERIVEEEKDALVKFENTVVNQIIEETKGRYQEELDSLKVAHETTCEEQKETEEKVKEITLMLSKQYETYLGKEVLNVAMLDRLIAHIESGEATTIKEALALEKK